MFIQKNGSNAVAINDQQTLIDWAKKQIAKYDVNRDGKLTENEWRTMRVDPTGADTNKDGEITLKEYVDLGVKR